MTPQPGFAPHVSILGQGPRRVLALHCTMAFSGAWGGVSRLCPDLTLVAPDMPSHGRSADWDGHSSFGDTVYRAALERLDAPMDVVGHSFGGAIALRLAVSHPELIRSLTLFEPVFFHVAGLDDPGSVAGHGDAMDPIEEAMSSGDFDTAARLFNRMWSTGSPLWADLPEQTRAAMARAVHVVPSQKGFLFDDTARIMPGLHNVTMPCLLMHGAETLDVVKATNSGLSRRLMDAEMAELPGVGHMGPITHPKEFAEVLTDFLERKVPW